MIEELIHKMKSDSSEVLVYQYSPNIQVQSGLGDRDKQYFIEIFGKGNPSNEQIEEFIHSSAEGWDSSEAWRSGAKMIIYNDGRVVIGKAPYHTYLSYYPASVGSPVIEAYFNIKSKKITVSHTSGKSSKMPPLKKACSNLLSANLIDNTWTLDGCPPVCDDDDKPISVGDVSHGSDTSQTTSKKERETEGMVSNFLAKKAIEDREKNMMGYMYRYGDSTIQYSRLI